MYERFAELVKRKGVKITDVAKATGIRNSTFTDWKMGRTNPKLEKLQKIADYFGVSVEYLITGEQPSSEPYYLNDDTRDLAQFLFEHPDYKALFDASRKTKPEDFEYVLAFLNRTNQ